MVVVVEAKQTGIGKLGGRRCRGGGGGRGGQSSNVITTTLKNCLEPD